LLPRSGATLTFLPGPEGGGKAYLVGGQEPVAGVILDELLVRQTCCTSCCRPAGVLYCRDYCSRLLQAAR
jgi:hypothetical protein